MIPKPRLYTYGEAEEIASKLPEKWRKWLNGNIEAAFGEPPEVLEKVREIIRGAFLATSGSFVYGTYESRSQSMNMSDFPLGVYDMLAFIFLRELYLPIYATLKAGYYLGRRQWWRHESIHARHHLDLAWFLNILEGRDDWKHLGRVGLSSKAGDTVYESGFEELFTRTQAPVEGKGLREKLLGYLALLGYMLYSPFTSIRNLFSDLSMKIRNWIRKRKYMRYLKVPFAIGTIIAPLAIGAYVLNYTPLTEIASKEYGISKGLVEDLISRGASYTSAAIAGGWLSSKEKGMYEEIAKSSKNYKFPYTYNPLKAFWRCVKFVRYIRRALKAIPPYREVYRWEDIEEVLEEVGSRLKGKDREFTLEILREGFEKIREYIIMTKEVYPRAVFTAMLYLRLRDYFV